MSTGTTEHKIDKTEWARGAWDSEPDHLDFEHRGVPCIIHRSVASGALCGYAAVPPGHPWHGKRYQDIDADDVNGGLTYGEACQGAICHVPKPGEPDGVYWIGFDCAHGWDIAPAYSRYGERHMGEHYSTYKTVSHVRQMCEGLADQIIEAAKATT